MFSLSFRLNVKQDTKFEIEESIEDRLLESKRKIDAFHQEHPDKMEYYRRATNFLDPFKTLLYHTKKKSILPKSLTNAWLKCWELIHEYGLIPRHHPSFRIFCNAELPGAFLFAIHHYMQTKTDDPHFEWFANSLYPTDPSILGDEFGLYRKYKEKWLMDEHNGGSVTDPDMIQVISDRLFGTVDLYTSDIGIGLDQSTFHLQEERQAPLHLGQVICALRTLKEGGHMVCKMFMFFKPFSKWFLYKLTALFDELFISKPASSRTGNSEVYLVGKYYKNNPETTLLLETILENWTEDSLESGEIPDEFDRMISNVSRCIYQRQIDCIEQHIEDVSLLYDEKIPTVAELVRKRIPRIANDERRILKEWNTKYWIPPIEKTL